jgi:hypothetical protein
MAKNPLMKIKKNKINKILIQYNIYKYYIIFYGVII